MADVALDERRRVVAPARHGRRMRRAGFVGAFVVLAFALAIGSGVGSSAPPTAAQRAVAIDAVIRCPSCSDLSVAQSSASSAVAVRHEVARLVRAGETTTQIENRLVDQYGPTILLSPPTSGLSAVVWYLPVVAGAAAVAVLGTVFVRRARAFARLKRDG